MHRANSVRHNNEQVQMRDLPPKSDFASPLRQTEPIQVKHTPQDATHGPNIESDCQTLGAPDTAKADFKQQPTYIKSCLSDGDFGDILIKVEDKDNSDSIELNQTFSDHVTTSPSDRVVVDLSVLEQPRRRSSCSDAEDAQRSRQLANSTELQL